jgi:glycine cleavage system H lipoate-binding protein
MVGILLVATLIGFFLVDLLVLRAQKRRAWPWQVERGLATVPEPKSCPADRFFCPNHTWFKIQPEGRIRLGVDAFVLYSMGVPESLELAGTGAIAKGAPLFRLKAGARQLVIPAAVPGRVTAINQAVLREPQLLAEEGDNWVVEMEADAVGAAASRMKMAEKATLWIRAELDRLKEFAVRSASPQAAWAESLADGGAVVPAVLQHLEEPSWREFEQNFLRAEE